MDNNDLADDLIIALTRTNHAVKVERKPDPDDFWHTERDYVVFETLPGEIKEE